MSMASDETITTVTVAVWLEVVRVFECLTIVASTVALCVGIHVIWQGDTKVMVYLVAGLYVTAGKEQLKKSNCLSMSVNIIVLPKNHSKIMSFNTRL